MPAEKISLDNAKPDKLFYFVANVVVYRSSDKKCLILQRSASETVHPNKYCVPGGKLEWSQLDIHHPTRMNGDVFDFQNAVEQLLARECEEEAGIMLKPPLHYLNSVAFVRPDETPVILIKFAAEYADGAVKLEAGAFTDYAWVNAEEVKQYSCIDGIAEEVATTIRLFNGLQKDPQTV